MVLGKLPVPGRPTIWMTVGQGPAALAIGAGGGCLDIFTLIYLFSLLSPSPKMARYRLKYCLKGPLNPKQPTNLYHLSLPHRKVFKNYANPGWTVPHKRFYSILSQIAQPNFTNEYLNRLL